MKIPKAALITLEYPPDKGGIASYLSGLVEASAGTLRPFVSGDFMKPGRFGWLRSISFIIALKSSFNVVLVSHLLPMGTAAWIARRLGGLPYVVFMHGLDLRLAQKSARKAWLAHRILRAATLVVANSDFTAREINAFDHVVHPLTIAPAVSVHSMPDRTVSRARLGIRNDEFILLSVCRLVERKGVDRVIASLASLPDNVRLVIIGDGPDRERLQGLAQSAGRRVTFLSAIPDEDRDAWYAAADLFVLPARDNGDDVEGFGIVYLEAALAGLPIIAGKSGGVPEAVLDGKTGLLVDPTDDEALTAALQQFIHDKSLRETFGAAGKERAKKEFQWSARWQTLSSALSKRL
ncbi:MAG: glycosyltransferase family 4 protein [bacterium]|nr:glycosyltransferase family 4 protein [bacterium]